MAADYRRWPRQSTLYAYTDRRMISVPDEDWGDAQLPRRV